VEEACRKTIHIADRIEPNLKSSAILDRNYQAYRTLYSSLSPAIDLLQEQERNELSTAT